jgi:GDPmannose 4,6-dehydratase
MKIQNISDMKNVTTSTSPIVFVSGVSGQDGSHMVDFLLKNTNAIIIGGARRLSVENHANLAHLINEPRFKLVNFDLTDSHSISNLVKTIHPDYFINFAAQSFVASSWDFAKQTWETNSTGVLDCLEAIRLHAPHCRFYNAGSSEEFGNVDYSPQDEKHPLKPRSPYGASKVAARTLVKVYRESYKIYAVQGWLFNHEGERRGEEFVTRKITMGVANIAKSINEGRSITPIELGNIYAKRDWSYSPDLMEGVWAMLNQREIATKLFKKRWEEKYGKSGTFAIGLADAPEWVPQDYVLSSGKTHTIKEFLDHALQSAGIYNFVWQNDGSDNLSDKCILEDTGEVLVSINEKYYRPAEVECLQGNYSRVKHDLGWEPKTDFSKLVSIMIAADLKRIGTTTCKPKTLSDLNQCEICKQNYWDL